jgi:hypothetical protein
MTAKLTDRERRRPECSMAFSRRAGAPTPENLGELLSMVEHLIRLRRGGWSEPFPNGPRNATSWQTLEGLICNRRAIIGN